MRGIKVIVINLILYLDSIVCEEFEGNSSFIVKAGSNFPKHIASKLSTPRDFIRTLIDKHNFYRDKHSSPNLKFNYTLCLISQAWADHLAETKSWGHNYQVLSRYRLGENIARFTQINTIKKINGSTSADLWYNEIKDYNFKTGQAANGKTVGHFTQLVWRSTSQVGAAMAIRKERNRNIVYVVANYYKQGNENGKFLQNVLPYRSRKPNPKIPVKNPTSV